MSNNSRSNNSSSGGGCLVAVIMAVIAMPLLGLYLAFAGESDDQKVIGVALLIVGIIVWIKLGMAG